MCSIQLEVTCNDTLRLCCWLQDAEGNQTSAGSQMKEVKLPIALEKVLAFKGVRVSQVGMKPEDLERVEKGSCPHACFILSHSSPNDLLCVEWDVKPYTLTHSVVMKCYKGCGQIERCLIAVFCDTNIL